MNNFNDKLCSLLCKPEFEGIRCNVPLCDYTSFKIGGRAALFAEPNNEDALMRIIFAAREHSIPYFVFGNGSNLLVTDDDIDALFIRIGERMSDIAFSGTTVTAGAGALLTVLSKRSVSMGLMGLEWANGIPGTVGGAVAMNAGAYGGEIKSNLRFVTVLQDGEIKRLRVNDEDLGYRKSAFSYPKATVLSAQFDLDLDDGAAIIRMNEYKELRTKKQPLAYPSAGSVFKRPKGHFAGELIENAGLKGASCGGAMVSTLHAGFIVNTGGATARDVLSLIDTITQRVYKISGVLLEPEIRIIDTDFCQNNSK